MADTLPQVFFHIIIASVIVYGKSRLVTEQNFFHFSTGLLTRGRAHSNRRFHCFSVSGFFLAWHPRRSFPANFFSLLEKTIQHQYCPLALWPNPLKSVFCLKKKT